MQRRSCSVVVALLATLLLGSAVGVTYVNIDGTTNEPAPASLGKFAHAGDGVLPGKPPTDATYVYVNAGTSNNSWPWSTSLGTSMRFQMLYLASEIGRSGRITWFAFQNGTNLTRTFNNVVIKMCHTSITAVQASDMNANYGGSTPDTFYQASSRLIGTGVVDGWDSIPGDFSYNGTDNLLVEVVWNTAGTGSSITSRYGGRTPTRRTWVWNWQGNVGVSADAYLYNARFTFEDNDVGVSKLIAPTGAVDSGVVVTPACSVYNYGGQAATYQVRLRIGSFADSATVTAHQPGTAEYVTFADWTALQRGTSAVSCSTELTGDGDASNDFKADSVRISVTDVGVFSIAVPTGSYPEDTFIRPKATWRNYGTQNASFEAWALLSDSSHIRVYAQKLNMTNLIPGGSIEIGTFPPCTLKTPGAWTARCSTFLTGDTKNSNDTLDRSFTVVGSAPPPPPGGGWTAKSAMPLTPSGKEPKDGAWMVQSGDLIYAAKGYKKQDFYAYNPVNDSWRLLAPWPPGVEAKGPGKGSFGVSTGDVIYAVKGNNTQGFWAYYINGDSWRPRANVPLGYTNKKVKGGTGLVNTKLGHGGEGDYLYMLKGYKDEFWRYSTEKDSWYAMINAPTGSSNKWDKGSWIVAQKAPGPPPKPYTIYAHKAKYHEFYTYNTATDSWNPTRLTAMPIAGSGGSKKSKDGGCAALLGDYIYAFKGANTTEFWAYDVDLNVWAEKETIPSIAPGTTKKKKVKGGASLVGYGDVLYGMKGNRASNIWLYTPPAFAAAPMPEHEGVAAEQVANGEWRMAISPNPLAGGFVHLVVGGTSLSRPALVRLYDVAGRCVGVWKPLLQNGAADFDVRHLAAGVYLVKVETDDFTASQKFVVQR